MRSSCELPCCASSWIAKVASPDEFEAVAGVVTYISRGTDEDALGVLAAFAVTGRLAREEIDAKW
jgi:hypothetical protein